MILPLLLLATAQAGPPSAPDTRYAACIKTATENPAAGEAEAGRWQISGGGFLADQCLGIAFTNGEKWTAAASQFEKAARTAELGRDERAALYWAQAGNAWLAARNADKARADLDAALAAGTLTGLQKGEAHLDRARALVATGDLPGARGDLDEALGDAAGDPLAWLLSATLARRMNDLPRAQKDIAEALRRSGDDASVQLEAGNIAASAGDEAGAKAAWNRTASLAPDDERGRAATAALKQFDTPAKP